MRSNLSTSFESGGSAGGELGPIDIRKRMYTWTHRNYYSHTYLSINYEKQ